MKHREKHIIRSAEVDSKNRLKPSAIVELLQEAAMHHIEELRLGNREMHEKERKAFVISRLAIETSLLSDEDCCKNSESKQLIPGEDDEIEIVTWAAKGHAANFPRCYEIRFAGKTIIEGIGLWALVDVDTKRLIKYKDYYADDSFTEPELELDIALKYRLPEGLDFKEAHSFKVMYSHTDSNGHMNNVKYIDPMWDAVPGIEERAVKAFEIHYARELRAGDEVRALVAAEVGATDTEPSTYYVIFECEGVIMADSKWVLA